VSQKKQVTLIFDITSPLVLGKSHGYSPVFSNVTHCLSYRAAYIKRIMLLIPYLYTVAYRLRSLRRECFKAMHLNAFHTPQYCRHNI